MSQDITAMDYFCGAGGSSNGIKRAGVIVRGAANHWGLAIETHNTNHPTTEHFLDDLQQAHPSWYPRTDIAWFSPECTNHSLAKGRKRKNIGQLDLWGESKVDPSEERSRATMREVVEFTAYHQYEIVIVENVVDIRHWQHYDDWLTEMLNLGYHHKVLYLNAQFFGVPQSRDRFYAVFWKKGNPAPNLDFRPAALCRKHGMIQAIQAWKKPQQWGRYGARRQYVYRCPHCGVEVMPGYRPAADVIDWSLPSEKIGQRKKPLKEKTLKRVLAGLTKFGHYPHVADLGHSHAAHNGKVHSIDDPLPTLVASASQHGLVTMPAFITSYYSREEGKGWPISSIDDALPTIPGDPRHALVTPPFIVVQRGTGSKDGIATPVSLDGPMRTITSSQGQHILIEPPIVMSYYGDNPVYVTVDQPLPTMRTVSHEALITPEDLLPECGFRMLEPHELKRGMGFPAEYIILGSKRDQVKQIGNAVCEDVAEWIVVQCVESLS